MRNWGVGERVESQEGNCSASCMIDEVVLFNRGNGDGGKKTFVVIALEEKGETTVGRTGRLFLSQKKKLSSLCVHAL